MASELCGLLRALLSTHMMAQFCQADDGPVVRGQGALWVTQGFAEHVRHTDLKVVRACTETPAHTRHVTIKGPSQDINVP